MSIRRRGLLRATGLIGIATGLGGCTGTSGRDTDAASDPPLSTVPEPSGGSSDAATSLPRTKTWFPSDREISPQVKTMAVRMVETAAAWDEGGGTPASARQRLEQAGYDPALADDLGPLLGGGETAAAQVVVAQYGGILTDSASVLVVVDQWTVDERGGVRAGGTTLDVRLQADEPQWMVTEVRPARLGGYAVEPSRVARQLLENDRVVLPLAAVSDVRSGAIDPSVLQALTLLSGAYRLDVSILRSGHPLRVFGTDRISNHTEGLAVDIWAIDGRPIIEMGASPLVTDLMRAASDVGAYQVGGPADLDAGNSQYFADDTHQDHIHLGFPA